MTPQRIDITIWPHTGEISAHKHETQDGSDPPTAMGLIEAHSVRRSNDLADLLRLVWPDVRASWGQLGVFGDDEIVRQMVADGTLHESIGQLVLEVLGERS